MRELLLAFVDAMNAREWATLRSLLAPDLVFELPQRHERIDGRDAYIAFNSESDSGWRIDPQVIVADDHHGAILFRWLDGETETTAAAFFGFTAGAITRITDLFP